MDALKESLSRILGLALKTLTTHITWENIFLKRKKDNKLIKISAGSCSLITEAVIMPATGVKHYFIFADPTFHF